MPTTPKVFLSHASDDKQRFVVAFAKRLRENGVDAWLDKWEMLPGDSLVDKIFEEGLKEADAVIIVLSQNSIDKPWVREELNSAVVARIERGAKLIPVVLDDCSVPEALKTTLWERITSLDSYAESFDRILASIYAHSIKPALGQPPPFASVTLTEIKGLEPIDNIVLKVSGDHLLENPDDSIDPADLFGPSNPNAPPKTAVLDALEVLEQGGYITQSKFIGGGSDKWGCYYRLTLYGFDEYCKAYVPDYGALLDRAGGLIVNEGASSNLDSEKQLGVPLMLANQFIRLLENGDYVKVSGEMGARISIYEVSAKLRRALR